MYNGAGGDLGVYEDVINGKSIVHGDTYDFTGDYYKRWVEPALKRLEDPVLSGGQETKIPTWLIKPLAKLSLKRLGKIESPITVFSEIETPISY